MVLFEKCALAITAAFLLTACSETQGSGRNPPAFHESEPNDTFAGAVALDRDADGTGDVVTPGDVDYWSAELRAGQLLRVELSAIRVDQARWDANQNLPHLALYDTDGVSRLLFHDPGGNWGTAGTWDWGKQDLELASFRVPANGKYFIAVTQDDTTLGGGGYVVRWSLLDLGGTMVEAEPQGVSGLNDDFTTAQAIQPGSLHGYHVDAESDYYSFTVPTSASSGAVVRLELTSYRNGIYSPAGADDVYDPKLVLYDADGVTKLAENDDAFFYDPALQYSIARPGRYFVEVTESGGAFAQAPYALSFSRTDLEDVRAEIEPNGSRAQATAFDDHTVGGLTVAGRLYDHRGAGQLAAGDVDYWSFTGAAGDMVRVQWLDRSNAQGSTEDVQAALLASDGSTVSSSAGCGDLQTLTTILQQRGTFLVEMTAPGSQNGTEYGLHVLRFKSADYETEPNNVLPSSGAVNWTGLRPRNGFAAAGRISAPGDVDVFAFRAEASRLTSLAIYADNRATGSDGAFELSGHGSDLDPLLRILDETGTALATSTSRPANATYTETSTDPLATASIAFMPTLEGTYFLEVSSASGKSGPSAYYFVEKE